MSAVFLDTVGIIALWDVRDQWHEAATRAFAQIAEETAELCTTTFVLAECANAVSRTAARAQVSTLYRDLETTGGLVIPSDGEWRSAWRSYQAGRPGAPGLVDEISFAVMRRLALQRAFTNDAHFASAGFVPLF